MLIKCFMLENTPKGAMKKGDVRADIKKNEMTNTAKRMRAIVLPVDVAIMDLLVGASNKKRDWNKFYTTKLSYPFESKPFLGNRSF